MIGPLIIRIASVGQSRAVQAGLAALLMPATVTTLHATGISKDPDAATLSSGLLMGGMWLTLSMAAVFGGLGGIVAELLSLHSHVEMPHRAKPRARNRRGQPI